MKSEITGLIVKILAGNASDAEKVQFERWLESDEKNKHYFTKVSSVWNGLNKAYNSVEFDTVAAKESILNKLNNRKESPVIKRFWFRISAAASILILLGIGLSVLFTGRSDYQLYSSENFVKKIVLPDNSHVWLNAGSKLQVPEKFAVRKRNVILEGEAYFDVIRDENKPFKVKAGNTVIKVLGTSFNIKMEKNTNVNVIVNTGKVAFYKTNSLKKPDVLTAGLKGEYSDNQIKITKNLNENYVSWKTGNLKFNNTPLKKVCSVLSQHFRKNITTTIADTLTLTGSFKNENLEDILRTVELTLDVEILKTTGEILISNK